MFHFSLDTLIAFAIIAVFFLGAGIIATTLVYNRHPEWYAKVQKVLALRKAANAQIAAIKTKLKADEAQAAKDLKVSQLTPPPSA